MQHIAQNVQFLAEKTQAFPTSFRFGASKKEYGLHLRKKTLADNAEYVKG